jgi:hypothetical protein
MLVLSIFLLSMLVPYLASSDIEVSSSLKSHCPGMLALRNHFFSSSRPFDDNLMISFTESFSQTPRDLRVVERNHVVLHLSLRGGQDVMIEEGVEPNDGESGEPSSAYIGNLAILHDFTHL